jgi:GTP cyclohydrolase I
MHGSLEGDETVSVESVISHHGRQRLSMGSWGKAEVSVRHFFWIEDLINLIEDSIEEELATLATDNNMTTLSVESLAREVANSLELEDAVCWFSVTVHNFADGYSTFATVKSP